MSTLTTMSINNKEEKNELCFNDDAQHTDLNKWASCLVDSSLYYVILKQA